MKKKLIIFTPIMPPYRGGASTYFNILLESLVKFYSVERVIVITEICKGQKWNENLGKSIIFRVLPRRLSVNKTIFRFLGLLGNIIFLPFILAYLQFRYKPNIYHLHFCAYARMPFKLIFNFFKFLFKIKLVVDVRDLHTTVNQLKKWNYVDLIMYCSKNIENKYASFLKNYYNRYIPVPIDIEQIRAVKKEKDLVKNYIIFVGNVSKSKGVPLLISAFKKLINIDFYENYNLLIIGPNHINNLQYLIGKNNKILYLGEKDRDETLKLIGEAKLLVLPSAVESPGRVALEAIALDTKVIFPSSVCELSEYCPNFGFHGQNSSELCSKIKKVLDFPGECNYPIQIHNSCAVTKLIEYEYNKLLIG